MAPARALVVEPARPGDEPELRRLLRETPMAGAISLSLEREPHFSLGAAVEGDRHRVLVARDAAGRVVALATRSVRTALVNGAPARLGYLGQLRVAPGARASLGLRALREGFARLADTRRPDELPFDLTSVVADNAPARRLLEAGLPGLPAYRPLGAMVTLALPARARRPRPPPGVTLARGAPDRLQAIAAFLAEDGVRRQLAACPTAADLASPARARGLAPEDFVLAVRGGALVGCAAVWDQRGFKQAVVRGYAGPLARVRPALDAIAPALGLPRLPRPGAAVAAAFLAHLAIRGDDPAIADALVDAALAAARARGLDHLLLGLSAEHPLLPRLRRRRALAYRSILYAVHGADGAGAAAALDARPLGPEVATL